MTKLLKSAAMAAALALAAGSASALTQSIEEGGTGSVLVYNPQSGIVGHGTFGVNITGNDNGEAGHINRFTVTADANERLIVNATFVYLNQDYRGNAFDAFYFDLAGDTRLLSSSSADQQIGSRTFTVNPGESFSFYIDSTDGVGMTAVGAVTGTIEVAAVPLPAAGLMLMAGLGGLAMLRRRGDKAAA